MYYVELFDSKNTSTTQIKLEAQNFNDAIKEVLEQTYWEFKKAYISNTTSPKWIQIDKKGKFLASAFL